MNRLACRHDPVARFEARLRYRPCRSSFEGSASIRSRPIISDPWVLKTRCIDVEVGAPQGKAASFVEWAACAAKPHRYVRVSRCQVRLLDVRVVSFAGDRVMSPRTPASVALLLFSDIGALAGCSGLDREHPSRGGRFTPSRSSPTRERP